MAKTKRNRNEVAYRFAVRVITEYGDYISAQEAWTKLVDKRGVGMKGWKAFQTHLGGAVIAGLLSKKRGEDSKGRSRVLYGPDEFREVILNTIFAAPLTEEGVVVEKVQRPNRPSINDIPLGDILSYNHVERDDIMSVIEDLLYDTPLGELRQRYPTLEDLAWAVALDGGEQ
tara:strand:- start:54 stop:569 length:516 start_codon:yes stop_codon:yes gene_type:complete